MSPPLVVVALGGNALLRRGLPLTAENQARAARQAAQILGRLAERHRLVVTHGNGPQVGLLALMGEAYTDVRPYPLDVLDAETEGQIGYVLELELGNALPGRQTAAVITRVLVDEHDPAFAEPTKFIGPVYAEREARRLALERGWTIRPDGDAWRRVVPSPDPLEIAQLHAIERLVADDVVVVCAGGGGVPVVADGHGGCRGVEAVIDKDLCSALLAARLGADVLVLATDVDAVRLGFGTADERRVTDATPSGLRGLGLAAGSMGPKAEACARFVEATGGRAAIGALDDIPAVVAGVAGTQVRPDGPELVLAEALLAS